MECLMDYIYYFSPCDLHIMVELSPLQLGNYIVKDLILRELMQNPV